jgi:excisionase family DNA binding protein
MMRDQDFGIVRVRAFGTYDFKVTNVPVFLKEVAGTDDHFRLDEFAETMRSRLVSQFSDALGAAKIPVTGLVGRFAELGDALLAVLNPKIRERYGIELAHFVIENVSVPPEVEQAIDKRAAMTTLGNLNDYVKYQMGQSAPIAAAQGGEGAGAMQMGMGFAMAQQMAQQMAQPGGANPSPFAASAGGAAPGSSALPDLLSPADVAKALTVSEADVLATLEKGELKGKKIGSTWRITRGAVDEFLKS